MLPPTRRGEPDDDMDVEAVAVADDEPGHDPFELTPELPGPEVEIEPVLVVDADPDPVAAPVPPRETVVEVEAAEPLETGAPLRSETAAPAAAPRSVPSVVVTPAIYATVSAALGSVPKKDRWIVLAAVLAMVVTGGFIWLATLPNHGSPALDLNAPPPAAAGLTVEVVDPPAPIEAGSPPVAEAPVAPRERRDAVAPAQTARPVASPVVAPTALSVEPRPYIEPAPLVVEAPTAAAPAPSDPDAPIRTEPQPLD
jgi:hypothetical protein